MSKWGIEEKETLDVIKKINLEGYVLNVAAGDGRFNNTLLENALKVMAIDISGDDLEALKKNCSKHLKNKLQTKTVDITKRFPFEDETFDGVFCTGTLHLFEKEKVCKILLEMQRVLKRNGKIVLDFATDIKRLDKNNKPVVFDKEGNYQMDEAILFLEKELKNFDLNIQKSTFTEENVGEDTGYQFITGNFLIINGQKLEG